MKERRVSEYLRKRWGESKWRRVVRYRLGNEMREGRGKWEEMQIVWKGDRVVGTYMEEL